ncbi:lactate dehydrogenase [Clostridium sp. JN-9]|uniref:lactate dehydrogenase n=1 Tax=Clostridium sp. JN-9 TaxID=2507159 RepID=UPI000FFE0767|nr:lactate dehydrogenase [Clostridium sp. JN-9]QAT40268.1 lactate dehydrogenase [Clostridium sp. JN-9]
MDKLFYYVYNENLLISNKPYNYKVIDENSACNFKQNIYTLFESDPYKSRSIYPLCTKDLIFLENEDLNILKNNTCESKTIPVWLEKRIHDKKVAAINTAYPDYEQYLNNSKSNNYDKFIKSNGSKKCMVNVIGLGDVGGTLVTGLRLLGGECISKIGIYDKDPNKIKRWEYECNEILSPDTKLIFPEVIPLNEAELFNCDYFVFCVSVGVPPLGCENTDVRLIQYSGNSKIIEYYAKLARKNKFKGIFAVVSDPVDLLCNKAFMESNKNENGITDFEGLKPEQIRGYGLGVMFARAAYYAKQYAEAENFIYKGRAFGPHGKGLVIANDIDNYNNKISEILTTAAIKANLKIRNCGFKPFVAPALSSGSLSIIETIKGNWNYSTTYIGGNFFGVKNRITSKGNIIETYDFNDQLFNKIKASYAEQSNLFKKL